MVRIIAWLLGLYLLWDYVIPYTRTAFAKFRIKRGLTNLDSKQYKVLSKVEIPTYYVRKQTELAEPEVYAKSDKIANIDYLIISTAGIIGITMLSFKYHFRGLHGYENREKWTEIRFSRIWLPFVDLNSYKEISNPLLKTKEKLAMFVIH